jgi:electron transport complex protein RnfB
LGREPKPLNPDHGVEQARQVAVIEEPKCIGCTLCIQACPVDAILGTAKLMHTVIAAECTGCKLCVAPCPVDCILLMPGPETPLTGGFRAAPDTASASELSRARADQARRRFDARQARLQREQAERLESAQRQKEALKRPGAEEIARSIERAKARKQARPEPTRAVTPSANSQAPRDLDTEKPC